MKFHEKKPPRSFSVGNTVKFDMLDCGTVYLEDNEQITFKTQSECEYDVARKEWGFYATPSLNGRLQQFNLRGVLIQNTLTTRYFIMLVEQGKEQEFELYMNQECLEVITWLDTTEALDLLKESVRDMRRCRD